MAEFKGTKGKWYLQEYSDAYTNIIRCNSGIGFETKWIGSTSQSSGNEERYNAKLMAAAPELLESFIKAISLLKQTTEYEVMAKFRFKVKEFEEVIKKATE